MKYCFYSLLYAGLAFAQSNITEFVPDLNGRSVAAAAYTAKDGDRTELNQSINGRQVPLQTSETRVLSDGPQGRTTETVVRKYDATGQLASTERTVVETQKRPNGARCTPPFIAAMSTDRCRKTNGAPSKRRPMARRRILPLLFHGPG